MHIKYVLYIQKGLFNTYDWAYYESKSSDKKKLGQEGGPPFLLLATHKHNKLSISGQNVELH